MFLQRKQLGAPDMDDKEIYIMGWKDSSVVKSIDCSSRDPEFNPQQPHGGLQPFVMRSDAFFWPAGIQADRAVYIINKINLKKKHIIISIQQL